VSAGADVVANNNIVATTGSITALAGNITATVGAMQTMASDIISGNNVVAVSDVIAGGNIEATTGAISALAGDISGTNLNIPDTTAANGQLRIQGAPYLHAANAVLNYNTCLGFAAGNLTSLAAWNTILGARAMSNMTDTDGGNVAVGFQALSDVNGNCSYNTACGTQALSSLVSGIRNSAVGRGALSNVLNGNYNTALGYMAGSEYLGVETGNICLGHIGVVGESNTIRIGTDGAAPNQQNKCYIAGELYSARSVHATNGNFANAVTVGTVSVVSGAGNPNGVVTAAKGSLYLNTTGSGIADRAWINTDGGTTWTNVTTAA